MKCQSCKAEIQDGQKFCTHCGKPQVVSKFCTNCGAEWRNNESFCGNCGRPLPKDKPISPGVAAEKPQAAPPVEVAKPFESEDRKHATILFVDMKGSSEMIRKMDPEEAKELIYPAIQKLSSIVFEYGGKVISTAGDGLLAIFGAPQALEDHALRACLAALSMQTQIKLIHPNLLIRVGLNSGEVLLTYDNGKYDVIGIEVNLAARMEQSAMPGTVRLTNNTLKLVSENISYEKVGSEAVKGFQEPVEIYELKGIIVAKSLNELTNQFAGRTGYVNREEEMAKVISLLKQAKAGSGNAVSLVAEAGFGKSRFISEFVQSSEAKGNNIILASSFIHTKEIPLLPIQNLFRTFFGIPRSETEIDKIKKLIEPYLGKIDSPYALSALLSLMNFMPNDPEWAALEPVIKRKYMFEAGGKLIVQYAGEKPLILIFEDIHWIDIESELFIDSFFGQIYTNKIFMIITYRNEYRDRWLNKPSYVQIKLSPLTPEYSYKMLDNLLGKDASLKELKMRLLKRVAGNPFFLEELVLSLIEQKIFTGEAKNYRLKEGVNVESIPLPETIISIYQTKIENLPPLEKRILQTTSVIGTKFVYSQLIELLEAADESQVRAALNQLVENNYIYESQLYPEPGFGFCSVLTLEIAYNSLLKKTRKSLHFKFFEMLKKNLNEDKIDQLQIVADNAYLSEAWDQAFIYCTKAAEKVYEISAFSACARNYEKALNASERLTQSSELLEKIMRIHYELYYAYVPIARFKEQFDHLQKALEIANQSKDRHFQSLIHSAFGIYFLGIKDSAEALKYSEAGYAIAKELNATDLIVIAQFTLTHVYLFRAQFKQLFETYQALETIIKGDLEFHSEWLKAPMPHIALNYNCWGHTFTGDFSYVDGRKEAWFAQSKNLERPSIPNLCRFGSMGINAFVKGDFEKALTFLPTAVQYSLSTEVIIFTPIFYAILGEIYFRLNKSKEGSENLDQAMNILEQIKGAFTSVFSFVPISRCLLLKKEFDKAKAFCDQSIQAVKERNVLSEYPMLLKISADIDLNLPSPQFDAIQKKLEEVIQLTTQYGMMPYLAQAHYSLANCFAKAGNLEKSKKSLEDATTLFEKLGMTTWVEQAKKNDLNFSG